jgi:hypothetical protein
MRDKKSKKKKKKKKTQSKRRVVDARAKEGWSQSAKTKGIEEAPNQPRLHSAKPPSGGWS